MRDKLTYRPARRNEMRLPKAGEINIWAEFKVGGFHIRVRPIAARGKVYPYRSKKGLDNPRATQ